MSKTHSRHITESDAAAPPSSELEVALDGFYSGLNDVRSVLHCGLETLAGIPDEGESEDLVHGVHTVRQCCRTLDRLSNEFDELSLRIAREGIPARFPETSKQGGRRHG